MAWKRISSFKVEHVVGIISGPGETTSLTIDGTEPMQCQGGRVKGKKRHAKNATESAQAEKPGNWKTSQAVISLVLGLFCFYKGCNYLSIQLFGIVIIQCKDPC